MNTQSILIAVGILGVMGIAFGLLLAYASKVFAVKVDERLALITEALPGANCGGCGYSGCAAYAEALISGEVLPGTCPVGGENTGKAIAEILGVELGKNMRITAMVRCSGGIRASKKFSYKGITDCIAVTNIGGGQNECQYGCVGLGSCVRACPFGAISIRDQVAVVDHEKCTGCLTCVRTCPKNVIVPVPYYADVNVICSSHDRGSILRSVCDIGCLGCRICEKTCKHDAIHVIDNLAEIDYEKCTGCGDCAEKCPRKLIVDAKLEKRPAVLPTAVNS